MLHAFVCVCNVNRMLIKVICEVKGPFSSSNNIFWYIIYFYNFYLILYVVVQRKPFKQETAAYLAAGTIEGTGRSFSQKKSDTGFCSNLSRRRYLMINPTPPKKNTLLCSFKPKNPTARSKNMVLVSILG